MPTIKSASPRISNRSALVFKSDWSVIKDNLPWVVDEMAMSARSDGRAIGEAVAIAPEVINAIALSVPRVINCHHIASRGILGRQVFIEMHLIVDADDVETAHQIIEEVEARLEGKFSPVRILIHIERFI